MTAQAMVVLGATGSIGTSTLDVIQRHPDRYRVYALTAQHRMTALAALCDQHRPEVVAVPSLEAAAQFRAALSPHTPCPQIRVGEEGLVALAGDPAAPVVVAAIVGAAGLLPTLAAVRAGKRVLLANKEALVMSGALFMAEARAAQALLLPIDSEHNAIFQCLPVSSQGVISLAEAGVERLVLTASGGPFRTWSAAALQQVTPAQAIAHPNWSMGPKISVDSATLMNKGLEFIEACWLFDATPDQIDVLVHPQSVIHSMVRYGDGSVLAQLGQPDMRTPIAHALAWPERTTAGVAPLDLAQIGSLTFERPDEDRFPCLRLARDAMTAGGLMPAVLNAANEVLVAAFLAHQLPFMDIPARLAVVMKQFDGVSGDGLDAVLAADAQARVLAQRQVDRAAS